jgi:hypothetical protein
MTYDSHDICQYGCLKKPYDLSNQASSCKSIYNLILNFRMNEFTFSLYKFGKSFVYRIFDSRIVNQQGKL